MALPVAPITHAQIAELFRGRFRDAIVELEELVARCAPDPHSARDYPLRHHFAPGQYAREIEIPGGEFVVGRIHRHAHVNVISKGRVIVWTENGEAELEAPATFVTPAATKRALLTLEDTVWTTIHVNPTNETDVAKIDAELIAPSYAALEESSDVER